MSVADPASVETIIDHQNKFILIKVQCGPNTVTFKDSYRIFPCSLNELCNIFGVDGKLSAYKKEFNSVAVLSDQTALSELIEYNRVDCTALRSALVKAQASYLADYKVDIATIVSTSSLALKIYRTLFQPVDIPILILSKNQDTFIRQAYFGGATDVYLKYANSPPQGGGGRKVLRC